MSNRPEQNPEAVPTSFAGYLRAWGPGIVVVLTWLGAGDLVDAAVAGSNYGYDLMWALAGAILVRCTLVSCLARFVLCNPHRDSVMGGLQRVHRSLPIVVGLCALPLGLLVVTVGVSGCAEATWFLLNQTVPKPVLTILWTIVASMVLLWPKTQAIETIFKVILGILSVCLVSLAVWSTPCATCIVKGTLAFSLPPNEGALDALLVVLSLIGAVGGSFANLFYPYYIAEKGWNRPQYLPVQRFDLWLSVGVLIVLDLSVWITGAEILKPLGLHVSDTEGLAQILGQTLGWAGQEFFYVALLAAVFTTIVGTAMGMSHLLIDCYSTVLPSKGHASKTAIPSAHPAYKGLCIAFCIGACILALNRSIPFVPFVVLVNAALIFFVPVLTAAIWYLTSRRALIGAAHANRWWEHAVLAALLVGSVYAVITRGSEITQQLYELMFG
jgi:Mn2+/Fe2+ NRAMP family transporter